jgi:hypothetical protein
MARSVDAASWWPMPGSVSRQDAANPASSIVMGGHSSSRRCNQGETGAPSSAVSIAALDGDVCIGMAVSPDHIEVSHLGGEIVIRRLARPTGGGETGIAPVQSDCVTPDVWDLSESASNSICNL